MDPPTGTHAALRTDHRRHLPLGSVDIYWGDPETEEDLPLQKLIGTDRLCPQQLDFMHVA